MKSTDELLKILKNSSNPKDYIEKNYDDLNNTTFPRLLEQYRNQRNLTRAEVINAANIQKNYGYQIFDGSRVPSRDKVLALGFAMHLSIDEINRLLKLSDHAILYPRIRRDSIILFALEKGLNLMDANLLLDEMQEVIIE